MTDEMLEEIGERLNAATPGPWRATESSARSVGNVVDMGVPTSAPYAVVYCHYSPECQAQRTRDVALIAHAPTDIAALLAEVKRLREEYEPRGPACGLCTYCDGKATHSRVDDGSNAPVCDECAGDYEGSVVLEGVSEPSIEERLATERAAGRLEERAAVVGWVREQCEAMVDTSLRRTVLIDMADAIESLAHIRGPGDSGAGGA